jgi:hypothetical protein
MKRRQAILRITLSGAGLAAAFGGYKWYGMTKSPDITYLEHHRELLAALAETIIPATDTPGAGEAGVADFIVMMIRECADRKTQNRFLDGLKELEDHCWNKYGHGYAKCTTDEQHEVMSLFEKKGKNWGGLAGKAQDRFLGKSFFNILKDYTVEGYCTSELGATKGLAYVNVPGSFHGCIPLSPGQKVWATN